jgi:hypothetical protein
LATNSQTNNGALVNSLVGLDSYTLDKRTATNSRGIKMLKTIYITTASRSKALRKYRRLIARGFIVMWTGEGLICLMKRYKTSKT